MSRNPSDESRRRSAEMADIDSLSQLDLSSG
jgi:hypothetical protein